MASSNVLTGRPIFKEDMAFSQVPNPAAVPATVLGAGTVNLHPVDALILSNLVQAVSDAAAAAAGLVVGDIYWNTVSLRVRARMT